MFDLEQSIAEWRKQMLAAGIKTPVPLEELENHLREDVKQQLLSGLNAQQAFEAAVRQIGQADSLKSEFQKAGKQKTEKNRRLRRLLFGQKKEKNLLTRLTHLLWGLFFLQIVLWQPEKAFSGWAILVLLALAILVILNLYKIIVAIKQHNTRPEK